jgi:hypothetical protein
MADQLLAQHAVFLAAGAGLLVGGARPALAAEKPRLSVVFHDGAS